MYALFDLSKFSFKTMTAFSYLFRGPISSHNFFILILENEYWSGGDLVTFLISRLGITEKIFNIRCVLSEKPGPTKSGPFFSMHS